MDAEEIEELTRVCEIDWPHGAEVREALAWKDGDTHCRKVSVDVLNPTDGPVSRVWVAARLGAEERWALTLRPVVADELASVLEVLREVGVQRERLSPPVGEGHYDIRCRYYTIVLTPLRELQEGIPYERWGVRYHADGRLPSVAYSLEVKAVGRVKTLPGGGVVRGTPYES